MNSVEMAPMAVREMAFRGIPWNRVVLGKSTCLKAGVNSSKFSRGRDRIDRLVSGADGKENAYEIHNAMQNELMQRASISSGTELVSGT